MDDGPALDDVEALMASEPGLSERAAVVRVAGDEESTLRRIQRKLLRRRLGRSGADLEALAELGFVFSAPREDGSWTKVDFEGPGGTRIGLALGRYDGRPLLLRTVDDAIGYELPNPREGDHPVWRAYGRLPGLFWWDHPLYQGLCKLVGLPADKGRPFHHPLYAAYQNEALTDRRHREDWSAPRRSAFAPSQSGKGLDAHKMCRLATNVGAAGEWDTDPLVPEILAAYPSIDWEGHDRRAFIEMVLTPWNQSNYHPVAEIALGHRFGELDGRLCCGIDALQPNVFVLPRPWDLTGRRAATILETGSTSLAVTREEAAILRSGDPWNALGHAVAQSYARYVARRTGTEPDLCRTYLSAERGRRDVSRPPAGWEESSWRHDAARGLVVTGLGSFYINLRGDGTVLVSTGIEGTYVSSRRVRFSATFILRHASAPSAFPLIGTGFPVFEAVDADDGVPLPSDMLLGIVRSLAPSITALARTVHVPEYPYGTPPFVAFVPNRASPFRRLWQRMTGARSRRAA